MAMRGHKRVGGFVAAGIFLVFFLLVMFPARHSALLQKAKADSLDAYPTVCLGGWQNPHNAAGAPGVQPRGDSFSSANSAVLSGTSAQIFCGNFQSDDQSQPPSVVTLRFSWNVIFASQATSSVATDTDSQAWSSVLDASNTVILTGATGQSGASASSVPPTIPATPTDNAVATTTSTDAGTQNETTVPSALTATSSIMIPDVASSTPTSSAGATEQDGTASSSVQSATINSASSSSSVPDQSQGPATSNQSSTSLWEMAFEKSFAMLISKTYADASDTSAGPADFLDVSYSLDGQTWQDLGQVNADNWKNFSVTIPVTSWDDINTLQIQLSPIPSVDMPAIYLDSAWLHVDYGTTFTGVLQQGANLALNAINSLSDAVNGAMDSAARALTNALSSKTSSVQPQNSQNVSPVSPPHRHTFQVSNTLPFNVNNPQWLPPSGVKGYDTSVATSSAATPTITLSDQNTIRVSGICSSYYYTILLFRNQTDYKVNPAAAVFNEAVPCTNGNFNETFSDADFPPNLASGTYYFMVASQGLTGTWIPYPIIYPVVIGNASS